MKIIFIIMALMSVSAMAQETDGQGVDAVTGASWQQAKKEAARKARKARWSGDSILSEEYRKFRVGGYGEILAQFKDYGINRFNGTAQGATSSATPSPSPASWWPATTASTSIGTWA